MKSAWLLISRLRNQKSAYGELLCGMIVLYSLCRKNTVCERYDFDFHPCVILKSEKIKKVKKFVESFFKHILELYC